jgi:hypothetical protein
MTLRSNAPSIASAIGLPRIGYLPRASGDHGMERGCLPGARDVGYNIDRYRIDEAPEPLDRDWAPVRGYRERLTVTRNRVLPVFALVSDAEHVTSVRPILNRLPDLGVHDTGTSPSTASWAVTL